ncbi:coiled-coil domain-containing protein [Frigoriglobus tundricola]|nr:hypothetical protein [Frigoriglobus tundricola]
MSPSRTLLVAELILLPLLGWGVASAHIGGHLGGTLALVFFPIFLALRGFSWVQNHQNELDMEKAVIVAECLAVERDEAAETLAQTLQVTQRSEAAAATRLSHLSELFSKEQQRANRAERAADEFKHRSVLLRSERDQFEERLTARDASLAEAGAECERVGAELARSREDLAAAHEARDRLADELEDARGAAARAETHARNAADALERFRVQSDERVQTEHQRGQEARAAALRTEERARALETECARLAQLVAAHETEADRLRSELATREAAHRARLDSERARLGAAESAQLRLTRELEQQERERTALETDLAAEVAKGRELVTRLESAGDAERSLRAEVYHQRKLAKEAAAEAGEVVRLRASSWPPARP